jgi:hypothetical protein
MWATAHVYFGIPVELFQRDLKLRRLFADDLRPMRQKNRKGEISPPCRSCPIA